MSDNASEEIQSINLMTSTDVTAALKQANRATGYKGYLIGTYGNDYGENIYNPETKEFEIAFSAADSTQSLATGLDVQIITKEKPSGYSCYSYAIASDSL